MLPLVVSIIILIEVNMKTLVTTGRNPDLDGVSSALGYAELLTAQGKEAIVGFEGKPLLDAEFMLNQLGMFLPELPQDFDEIVLVDLGNMVYAPRAVQKAPELVVKVMDHRILHNVEIEFPSLRETDLNLVGACATIVTEDLYRYKITPSRVVATLLHAAIYSNTLNLKASVTTEQDLRAVANLSASYPMSQQLIEGMFAFRTKLSADQLRNALKGDFDPHSESPEGSFGIAQIEALDGAMLIKNYRELIYNTLIQLKAIYKLTYTFLTVPSIQQGVNYLYAIDEETSRFLHRYLDRELTAYDDADSPGILLKTRRLLLRKQIKPMFQYITDSMKDLENGK